MAECVRSEIRQAVRLSPAHARLQRVVLRRADVHDGCQAVGDRSAEAGRGDDRGQVVASSADIGHHGRGVARQLALHAEIPLLHLGVLRVARNVDETRTLREDWIIGIHSSRQRDRLRETHSCSGIVAEAEVRDYCRRVLGELAIDAAAVQRVEDSVCAAQGRCVVEKVGEAEARAEVVLVGLERGAWRAVLVRQNQLLRHRIIVGHLVVFLVVRREQVITQTQVERQLRIDVPVVLREDGILPTDRVARHEAGKARCGEVGRGVVQQHVGDFVAAVSLLEPERITIEVEAFAETRALLGQIAAQRCAAELEGVVAPQPRHRVGELQGSLFDDVLAEIPQVLDISSVTAADQRDTVGCGDATGSGNSDRLVLVRSESDGKESEVEAGRAGAKLVHQVAGEDVSLSQPQRVALVF